MKGIIDFGSLFELGIDFQVVPKATKSVRLCFQSLFRSSGLGSFFECELPVEVPLQQRLAAGWSCLDNSDSQLRPILSKCGINMSELKRCRYDAEFKCLKERLLSMANPQEACEHNGQRILDESNQGTVLYHTQTDGWQPSHHPGSAWWSGAPVGS